MRLWLTPLALMTLLAGDGNQAPKEQDLTDAVQARICDTLSRVDPNPADKEKAEEALRQELEAIVEKHLTRLRPAKGSATLVSRDKRLVLVIGANGAVGANGQTVEATDEKALLVIAIAGDGGGGVGNTQPGFGGTARARAKAGIAIALGGRGGFGDMTGGGGGGGVSAEGAIGAVGLGGEGGKTVGGGGEGGRGGSTGIDNPMSIVRAIQKLRE